MEEAKDIEALVGIKKILIDIGIRPSEITLDAHLSKDLGLDSLDIADLVMRVEEAHNVKINHEDAESLLCVADLVNYVEAKLNNW